MANSIDIHVGQRVRQRRWTVGMTQQQLAQRVGTGFQQIQKYETGANRISASRLWEMAAALKVPVSYFYEGLEGQAPAAGKVRGDLITDKEAHAMLRAYYAIPAGQRRRLFDLARVLASAA